MSRLQGQKKRKYFNNQAKRNRRSEIQEIQEIPVPLRWSVQPMPGDRRDFRGRRFWQLIYNLVEPAAAAEVARIEDEGYRYYSLLGAEVIELIDRVEQIEFKKMPIVFTSTGNSWALNCVTEEQRVAVRQLREEVGGIGATSVLVPSANPRVNRMPITPLWWALESSHSTAQLQIRYTTADSPNNEGTLSKFIVRVFANQDSHYAQDDSGQIFRLQIIETEHASNYERLRAACSVKKS